MEKNNDRKCEARHDTQGHNYKIKQEIRNLNPKPTRCPFKKSNRKSMSKSSWVDGGGGGTKQSQKVSGAPGELLVDCLGNGEQGTQRPQGDSLGTGQRHSWDPQVDDLGARRRQSQEPQVSRGR